FEEMGSEEGRIQFARRTTSLDYLPRSYIASLPVITIGPCVRRHMDRFAEKIIKSLYYKHSKIVLPNDKKLLKRPYTNVAEFEGRGVPDIMKGNPLCPVLERNKKILNDQFEYSCGFSPDRLRGSFVVR